jgi:hypothetical protein
MITIACIVTAMEHAEDLIMQKKNLYKYPKTRKLK